MQTALLTELRARLQPTAGDLIIDRTAVGCDELSDLWAASFGSDTLRIGGAAIGATDASGNFTVTGTTSLLAVSDLKITMTFFLSHDERVPDEDLIECLIAVDNPPAELDLATIYPDMPGYLDYAPDQIDQGRKDSFLRQLHFTGLTLLHSSFDFFEADQENRNDPPPQQSTSLAAAPVLGGILLRQGLNLTATVTPEGAFWDQLATLRAAAPWLPSGAFSVLGAISPEDEGPLLRVGHSFADAQQRFPALSLEAGIAIGVKQLVIESPLSPGASDGPGLYLEAFFGDASLGFDVTVSLPMGATSVHITGSFEDGQAITLPDIETALGLSALEGFLPTPLDTLGGLGLSGFQADLSLAPLGLGDFTVGVGAEMPWDVVPDLVYVSPELLFKRTAGVITLDLIGTWIVGDTELDVYIETSSGQVGGQMALGEQLDLDGVFAELLPPGVEQPELDVLDLELTGNYLAGTFSFECEGEWSFDVGGATIAASPVSLVGDYDGESFSGSLTGLMTIAGWVMNLDVEVAEQITVELTIPTLNVSEAADQLLHAIRLPGELPDFVLNELDLKITPSTKAYSLSGQSPTEVDILSGFAFQLVSFAVSRDAAGALAAQLSLALALGSTVVDGSAAYSVTPAQATSGTPGAEWKFATAMPGEDILVGHLLASLTGMLGVAWPLPFAGLSVGDFNFAFNLGVDARYFVLSGSILDGATEYAKLSLVAQRATAAAPWDYALSAQLDLDISLSSLPLVGPQLASVQDMHLHAVECTFTSRDFTADAVAAMLALLPEEAVRPPARALAKGTSFQTQLDTGGPEPMVLSVPFDASTASASNPPFVPPDPVTGYAPAGAVDETRWYPVHLGFRSLMLERVGLRFQNGRLSLLLDAYLGLGPFELGLSGLGLSSPLDHFEPAFNLDGLSLGYEQGPLTISGGFLRTAPGTYAGQARVETTAFSLAALGEYGEIDGHTSLFAFAFSSEPLGGPPWFFVRGLAFGLGCNTRLNLPSAETVQSFSLVEAVLPGRSPFGQANDPESVLRAMQDDVAPAFGEQWLAAGVRFSSFELVQSFALVTVAIGSHFEVALLGVSQLSVPPQAPNPIAYVEMATEARFDPAGGVIAVDGGLTPSSYVLDGACRLTGGFSFYNWFAGDHEGDFVFTLGGYHPRFAVPAHYPRPPRVQLAWQVSSDLGIKGTMYFAATPQALMAGGALEALWQSGDIRAWFDTAADFLLYWKPFRYEADLAIGIGVSFTLDLLFTSITLTVHVGVGLSLHGPDFGGVADVDLSVISFSLRFGADPPPPASVSWPEFKSSFLPPVRSAPPAVGDRPMAMVTALATATVTDTLLRITVTGGLVRDLTKDADAGGLAWVINPSELAITTSSLFPSKTASFNGAELDAGSWTQDFGVGPVRVDAAAFSSAHQITIEQLDEQSGAYVAFVSDSLALAPVTRNVPGSLWGRPADDPLAAPALVANTLSGFAITPKPLQRGQTVEIDVSALQYATSPPRAFDAGPPPAPPADTYAPEVSADGATLTFTGAAGARTDRDFVLASLLDPGAQSRRAALLASLAAQQVPIDAAVDLTRMGTDTMLTDWPRVGVLGEALP